jgi:polysaccharide pyruvyl transferase WcaK-like protein
MFDLFKKCLLPLGKDYKVDVVNNEAVFLEHYPLSGYDLIVLGGGSIISAPDQMINPVIVNTLYKAIKLNKKIMIWGSGTDWVPQKYLLDLQNKKELNLTVNENLITKLNEVLAESVWTGVRGPLTLQLLKNLGVDIENIRLSGDPGFLLQTGQPNSIHHPFLMDQSKKIIGLNWGTAGHNIYGHNEIHVEDQLVTALKSFIQAGYKVYMFVVWQNDLFSSERLYSKVNDPQNLILDKKLYNQNELMNLISTFTFTLNYKLHANYLSLASKIPFIALGYRFKVFDFVKSVDLDEFIISTDSNEICDAIMKLEKNISTNRNEIVNKMIAKQNAYREILNVPFENKLYI